ncbi:MAG: hypothetical protein WBL35_12265, partial [Ornithinibacter sp.]
MVEWDTGAALVAAGLEVALVPGWPGCRGVRRRFGCRGRPCRGLTERTSMTSLLWLRRDLRRRDHPALLA